MLDGIDLILDDCLYLRADETVIIITDSITKNVSDMIVNKLEKRKNNFFVYVINDEDRPLKKIPGSLNEKLKNAQVGITALKGLADEGSFRFDVINRLNSFGARVIHMPDITKEIMTNKKLNDFDYTIIEKNNDYITSKLRGAKKVHIKSKNKTDISFEITKRNIHAEKGKVLNGDMINFPYGEVYVSPIENSANGVFVCDLSCGSYGLVKEPIALKFIKGKLVSITSNDKLKNTIELDLSNATGGKTILGEFGIGTNPYLDIIGNVLVDEKVLGTCHVALGNNIGLGGTNKSSIHIDFIINKPTIIIDDDIILMKEGVFHV